MAAGAATGMGYSNLAIYQAGFPDWSMKGNFIEKGNQPGKFKK